MKKGKQKVVLWFLMGVLFVAGLSWKGVTAQAATEEVTLTEISRPSEIEELEKQDIGLIHQGDRQTKCYYKFILEEQGWVKFDTINEATGNYGYVYGNQLHIYANESLLKEVYCQNCSDGVNVKNKFYQYYLESGTYYIECSAGAVYAYFMPVSKVMSVSSTVSEDKTKATITVNSPVLDAYKLSWTPDKIDVEYLNNSGKWTNTCLENSFDVEDNGTYSIRLSSTLEEWKDYPVSLTIDVSGIVKCEHDFSAYDVDEEGHIAKCKKCGKVETGEKVAHSYNEGEVTKKPTCAAEGEKTYTCTVCSAKKVETLPKEEVHSYDGGKVTLEPTCTAEGVRTYTCTVCSVTRTEAVERIAHNYENKITPATPGANGAVTPTCTVCGATGSGSVIWRPTSFVLSAKAYTYDGKVKKPTVTIRDDYGRALGSESYKLEYVGGCKKVGSYAVKIVFAGNYSGTKSLTFIINPKGTSISKVTAEKKSLKVFVKKQTGQTSGYEVQASTDKNFKKNVKKATMKNSKISTTIKNLKSGAKYYVRVRTYKSVGSKKFYSDWKKYPKVVTME